MADLLARTVAALLEAPEAIHRDAWQRALARLRGKRAGVALYLAALAPLGVSVQREATLAAAARGLVDSQAWWP